MFSNYTSSGFGDIYSSKKFLSFSDKCLKIDGNIIQEK